MASPLSLSVVSAVVVGGAAVATGATTATVVGRRGLGQCASNLRNRTLETIGPVSFLVGILVLNAFVRDLSPEVSRLIGWNVTGTIYAIEGTFVAHLQSVATPALTTVLSATYLSGYVFLLTFPFVAYASLETLRPLKRIVVALSINYLVGLLLYTLFISYGPRNLLPVLVEPLLYETYPRTQILTSQVNTNTNVFPSLHTSLSVTIARFAWQTRSAYPWWPRIAIPVAAGIVFSTMYLGIHWGVDVVAGVILGLLSVRVANRCC
jgi:membrane-associated phospholipid phosphatase